MLEGLRRILELLREPRLEIKNARVIVENANSKDEIKNLFVDIKNNGNIRAECCQIEIGVKMRDRLHNWVNPNFPSFRGFFDINPNDKKTIHLGRVSKEQPTTCIVYAVSPDAVNVSDFLTLTNGVYQLEVRLFGDNFVNEKIYRLKLDLSSWENIGIVV